MTITASQRADLERQRADAAEARVRELEAQLARMRPGTSGLLDEREAEVAWLQKQLRLANMDAVNETVALAAETKALVECMAERDRLQERVRELEESKGGAYAYGGVYDYHRRRIAALEAQLAVKDADQFAWVIERGDSATGAPIYWTGGDGFSNDNLDAVRFSRRVDAERVVRYLNRYYTYRIAEHWWMSPRESCRHGALPAAACPVCRDDAAIATPAPSKGEGET